MSDSTLTLQRLMDTGYVNLRGDAKSADFSVAVAKVTGLSLPTEPNTVSSAEHDLCWLGPDEWLLLVDETNRAALLAALREELAQQYAAVNDLSGGMVTYRLSGSSARELLSKGCTLDLHPDAFAPGACAQTGLAKAGVILRPLEDNSAIDVMVRRSFADYLWQWLLRAGREHRIEVT